MRIETPLILRDPTIGHARAYSTLKQYRESAAFGTCIALDSLPAGDGQWNAWVTFQGLCIAAKVTLGGGMRGNLEGAIRTSSFGTQL